MPQVQTAPSWPWEKVSSLGALAQEQTLPRCCQLHPCTYPSLGWARPCPKQEAGDLQRSLPKLITQQLCQLAEDALAKPQSTPSSKMGQQCVHLLITAPKALTARQSLLFLICKGCACDCTPLHAAQHFCIVSSADFTQRLQ